MIGKILIVDDVSSNRIVFKVKLTAAGYQTLTTADGEVALRLALVERPDIIVLNLSLGMDTLKALKAHPQTRRIPVIVVATQAQAALRLQALRLGAEDFLTRPIEDYTLQARLRAVMRMRQAVAGLGGAANHGLGLLGLAEPAQTFALPGQIALVLPQADKAMRLRRDLAAMGQDRFVIMAPEEVHSNTAGSAPDVYLLHADLGGAGGGCVSCLNCYRATPRAMRRSAFGRPMQRLGCRRRPLTLARMRSWMKPCPQPNWRCDCTAWLRASAMATACAPRSRMGCGWRFMTL